jgi:hypothetical protein
LEGGKYFDPVSEKILCNIKLQNADSCLLNKSSMCILALLQDSVRSISLGCNFAIFFSWSFGYSAIAMYLLSLVFLGLCNHTKSSLYILVSHFADRPFLGNNSQPSSVAAFEVT